VVAGALVVVAAAATEKSAERVMMVKVNFIVRMRMYVIREGGLADEFGDENTPFVSELLYFKDLHENRCKSDRVRPKTS